MNMRLIIKGAILDTRIVQLQRDLGQIDDEAVQEGIEAILDETIAEINKERGLS